MAMYCLLWVALPFLMLWLLAKTERLWYRPKSEDQDFANEIQQKTLVDLYEMLLKAEKEGNWPDEKFWLLLVELLGIEVVYSSKVTLLCQVAPFSPADATDEPNGCHFQKLAKKYDKKCSQLLMRMLYNAATSAKRCIGHHYETLIDCNQRSRKYKDIEASIKYLAPIVPQLQHVKLSLTLAKSDFKTFVWVAEFSCAVVKSSQAPLLGTTDWVCRQFK